MAVALRVRAYGRDLTRAKGIMASGACEAASKAEHMAAPTSRRQKTKTPLANGEPSTHGSVGFAPTLAIHVA